MVVPRLAKLRIGKRETSAFRLYVSFCSTLFESYRSYIETRSGEVVANILICLIHQTNFLLDQQIGRLQEDFLKEGGLRERMTRARLTMRSRQQRGG